MIRMNQLRIAIGLEDDSLIARTLERINKEDGMRAGKESCSSVSKHLWKQMLDAQRNASASL